METTARSRYKGSVGSIKIICSLILGGKHPRIQGSTTIRKYFGSRYESINPTHVSNTNPIFRLQNENGNYFDYNHTSCNDLEISYNGRSALVHLTNAGNFANGETSPDTPLHVTEIVVSHLKSQRNYKKQ